MEAPVEDVPRNLLICTALVCSSVMANFTILIPTSTYYTETLLDSGLIVPPVRQMKWCALGSDSDHHHRRERIQI